MIKRGIILISFGVIFNLYANSPSGCNSHSLIISYILENNIEALKRTKKSSDTGFNFITKEGDIPIINAVFSSKYEIISFLLKNKANPNIMQGTNSLLYKSIFQKDLSNKVLSLLVKHGARLTDEEEKIKFPVDKYGRIIPNDKLNVIKTYEYKTLKYLLNLNSINEKKDEILTLKITLIDNNYIMIKDKKLLITSLKDYLDKKIITRSSSVTLLLNKNKVSCDFTYIVKFIFDNLKGKCKDFYKLKLIR